MHGTFRDIKNNPYSNTYNSGWSKHLNVSWVNNQGQGYQIQGNPHPPGFQQEKRSSLEKLVAQFITKSKTNFQNQQATIKNLETQVGQIAAILANRVQDILPSDTKNKPRKQVLMVEALNYAIIEAPSIKLTILFEFMCHLSHSLKDLEDSLEEQVQGITTRSGVQLPEITMKKKSTEESQVPIMERNKWVSLKNHQLLIKKNSRTIHKLRK